MHYFYTIDSNRIEVEWVPESNNIELLLQFRQVSNAVPGEKEGTAYKNDCTQRC